MNEATQPAIEPVTDDDLLLAVAVMQTRLFADGPEKMTGDFGETLRYILGRDRRRVAERQAGRVATLGPIDRDDSYMRTYIPVAPGWEVQTKGKGSTFRICDSTTKDDGDRLAVPDSPYLHDTIERMALAIHAHRLAQELNIERLRAEAAFYKRRCELLQATQHLMRDPERTVVCDILANGTLLPDPDGTRYGAAEQPADLRRGSAWVEGVMP